MRIPVYRTEARASTEMPGRPIRARRSIAREAEQELAKGEVALAGIDAINEYAETRYKMETKNNLDNALLDAQEALRERREELAKSDLYGNVLDGDDPIWTRETSKLQRELSEKVGRDRYAQQQFQSGFRQLEIQNRYALRGDIDQRVQLAAAQNRDRKLADGANQIATSTDLSVVSMALQGIVNDTQKMAAIKAGNLDVLNKQQREMLISGITQALNINADKAEDGVKFIRQITQALHDGLPEQELQAFFDPRDEQKYVMGETALESKEAAYVYGLMRMLDPMDQVAILKDVGAIQAFFESPTEVEKQRAKQANDFANQISDGIGVRLNLLSDGDAPSKEEMGAIKNQIDSIAPNLDPDKKNDLDASFAELQYMIDLQKSLGRSATMENIDAALAQYEKGIEGRGLSGRDDPFEVAAYDFVKNYKEKMEKALLPDGDAIAFAEKNKMNQINIQDVDLSIDTVLSQEGPSLLALRIAQGQKLKTFNNLDYVPVLKKEESREVVANIEENPGVAGYYLKTITSQLSNRDAGFLLENLRREGLAPEYITAMYAPNERARDDIGNLAKRSIEDIKVGLDKEAITGASSVTNKLSEDTFVKNYKDAFLIGGDQVAERIFTEMYQITEKLAFSYLKDDSNLNVDAALQKAIKNVFVGNISRNTVSQFVAPLDIQLNFLESSLYELRLKENLNKFNIIPLKDERYPEFQNQAVSIASLASSGKWLNNGTGDGVTLHYNLNGEYIPVQVASGGYLDVPMKVAEKLDFTKLNAFEGELNVYSLRKLATGHVSTIPKYTGTGTEIKIELLPEQTEFPGFGNLDEATRKAIDEAQQKAAGQ